MANSSVDLKDMGILLQKAGLAINQKVHDNIKTLDFHEIQALSNKAQELFIQSKTMFARAVIEIGEEAKDSLQSLEDAKDKIDAVIMHISKVQDIIDFATQLVSTGSAILTGDVNKIVSNGQTIISDIKNLSGS